jgi:hypothetical protein
MSYRDELGQICATHHAQIKADLEAARHDYEDAATLVARAERRLHLLEGLLSLRGGSPNDASAASQVGASKMTLHQAMYTVLKDSPRGKLRAGDIIAEIDRRGLYRMRDGRIPESQQIHARAGHYPDMFGKDGPFFYAK